MNLFRIKIKNNKTLLNGGLFALFSFFNKGIGFVLLIILANFIEPTQYGQLSLFNTTVMFLGFFVAMSTEGYLSISYFKQSPQAFKSDITAIVSIAFTMAMFFLLVAALFGDGIGNALSLSKILLYIAIITAFCRVIYHMALDYYRVKEKVLIYGAYSCGYAILGFAITLILIIIYEMGWMGRIYADLACVLLFFILGSSVLLKNKLFSFTFTKKDIWRILIWGVPLIPHMATTWLRQGCDRFIINSHFDLTEVGLFSFALNLANVIEMLGAAFNSTYSVSIFRTLSDKMMSSVNKKEKLNRQSREILIIYSIACVFVVIGGLFFVPILMPKYIDAIPLFLVLSVYGLLRCAYYVYCNYFFYWGLNKKLMLITFGSAILHLALSLIFTRFSLMCTAAIYVVTQLTIDVLVFVIAKRKMDIELSNKISTSEL